METCMSCHYLSGEKELADKLRGVVEPISKQHETKEEQADILNKLGQLYLQNAEVERDGASFTKASALFNAALVRTLNVNQERRIKESLVKLKNIFLETFFVKEGRAPITLLHWEQKCNENKQTLEKTRKSIEHECSNLKKIRERYDFESSNKLEMEKVLVNEAIRVSLLVKEELMVYIKMLWEQVLRHADVEPLSRYSLLALGSLARQEATPFSDLEFAILVENQNFEIQEYFRNLTNLFHLIVLDLGETPLPCLAIGSLNNFMTPDGDWFYDKVTPAGFKLDGAMPWACKTPIGRQATETKAPLSLIKTPKEMADLHRADNDLGQAYHVADVLSQSLLVHGDDELHQKYHQEVLSIVESSSDIFKKRGFTTMAADKERYSLTESVDQFGYLNAKADMYRFPSTFVENLRLIYTPSFFSGSQWGSLEHLVENGILSEEGAFNLKVGIAISLTFRLLTYFSNTGQYESILLFQDHIDNVSILHRNHQKLHLRCKQAVYGIFNMIGSCVEIPENLLGELFLNTEVNQPFQTKSDTQELHLKYNFMWAEQNNEIPEFSCGVNCLRDRAEQLDASLDGIDSKLQTVDMMLQRTDQCTCIATLELHLKIYRYVLLKKTKLSKDILNVNIKYVLGIFRKSTQRPIRDTFFLLLGMFGMVSSYTEEKIVIDLIVSGETFLERIKNIPASQRNFILRLEIDFIYELLYLYRLVGQTDKIISVCETWIQRIEKPLRTVGSIPQLVYLCTMLAEALFRNPQKTGEAIAFQKKALKISETISLAEPVALPTLCDNVITLASMLTRVDEDEDAVKLLTKYFINEKDKFGFTNEQFLKASPFLVSCQIHLKQFTQASEVFKQLHGLMKDDTPQGLNTLDRYTLAKYHVICCFCLDRKKDIPQVFDFHALLCKAEKNQTLRHFETKSFIMRMAMMELVGRDKYDPVFIQGVNAYKRAIRMDGPTADLAHINAETVTWINAFFNLCDMAQISEVDPRESFKVTNFIFTMADDTLKSISHGYPNDIIVNRSKIYLDYRRSIHYLDLAVNRHKRYLTDTIGFLQQAQVLIHQYFPQSTSALKWVSFAIETAKGAIRKIPPEQRNMNDTFLKGMMAQRRNLLKPQSKVLPFIRNKLKTILSFI